MKTISKVGTSHEILLGADVLQHADLKIGDEVKVEWRADGGLTITPVSFQPSRHDINDVSNDYGER
jgi:antitoxin component of MazEF toxin-antitoxin module